MTVTKNTNKYNFFNFFLKEKTENHSRFLNHLAGNLPACFQIYGLFIRKQTASFGKIGFYFAGSYRTTKKLDLTQIHDEALIAIKKTNLTTHV